MKFDNLSKLLEEKGFIMKCENSLINFATFKNDNMVISVNYNLKEKRFSIKYAGSNFNAESSYKSSSKVDKHFFHNELESDLKKEVLEVYNCVKNYFK